MAIAPLTSAPLPWYRPIGNECELFVRAFEERLPVLLKGPTGCGKTRLVEHMAARLGRPLVTVACHDETSAVDLLGRWLVKGGDTVWQDGPVTRAVRPMLPYVAVLFVGIVVLCAFPAVTTIVPRLVLGR